MQQSGLVNLRGMTLRDLITFAWDTDRDAVVGAPAFLDEDRFDVSALVPSTVPRPVDTEAVRPMLRLLLQERFRLTTHEDEQPLEVYTLTRTRPDVKMKRGSDTDRGSCKSARGHSGQLGALGGHLLHSTRSVPMVLPF